MRAAAAPTRYITINTATTAHRLLNTNHGTRQAASLGPSSAAAAAASRAPPRDDFAQRASAASNGIARAEARLARLAAACRGATIFEDKSQEVDELTGLIKREIEGLSTSVSSLAAAAAATASAAGAAGRQRGEHAAAVVEALRARLRDATAEFKAVLTARTEALKADRERRSLFSAGAPDPLHALLPPERAPLLPPAPAAPAGAAGGSGGPFGGGGGAGAGGPFGGDGGGGPFGGSSSSSSTAAPARPTASSLFGGAGAGGGYAPPSELRQRRADAAAAGGAGAGPPSYQQPQQHQHQQQQMMFAAQQQQQGLASSRADALQSVEATIVELGSMFNTFAGLVASQHEAAARIDDNASEVLQHVDAAKSQLMKYLSSISSNRALMVKLLLVILALMAVFVLFVA